MTGVQTCALPIYDGAACAQIAQKLGRHPLGDNTRTWSFEGLDALLDRRRPRIVYLENQPDTMMAWSIGGWCRENGAVLIANSTENDLPSLGEMLRDRNVKKALRSIRSRILGRIVRHRVDHVVSMCEGGREAMEAMGFTGAASVEIGRAHV